MSSRKYFMAVLDGVLRITGLIGLVSFAENLSALNEALLKIWNWIGSLPFGETSQSVFRLLAAAYNFVADLFFGWLNNDQLRDSLMLFSALVGIVLILSLIHI